MSGEPEQSSSATALQPRKPTSANTTKACSTRSQSLLQRRLELMKVTAVSRAASSFPLVTVTKSLQVPTVSETTTTTSAAGAVEGMHDTDFYAAVARELGVDEPVLHSVVHTHRHMLPTQCIRNRSKTLPTQLHNDSANTAASIDEARRPSTAVAVLDATTDEAAMKIGATYPSAGGRAATAGAVSCGEAANTQGQQPREMSLDDELALLNDELSTWKVQRLSEHLEAGKAQARGGVIEREMSKRLWTKRGMEQDRALRRMHTIISTLEPKITQRVQEAVQREQQEAAAAGAADGGVVAASEAHRYKDSALTCINTAARAACMKHRVEREAQLQARVSEMRTFTQSWLAERDLLRKYEERESCGRQHWFVAQSIAQEEQLTRLQLQAALFASRAHAGFAEDERVFRNELCNIEEVAWRRLCSTAAVAAVDDELAEGNSDSEFEVEEEEEEEAANDEVNSTFLIAAEEQEEREEENYDEHDEREGEQEEENATVAAAAAAAAIGAAAAAAIGAAGSSGRSANVNEDASSLQLKDEEEQAAILEEADAFTVMAQTEQQPQEDESAASEITSDHDGSVPPSSLHTAVAVEVDGENAAVEDEANVVASGTVNVLVLEDDSFSYADSVDAHVEKEE